MSSTSSTSSRPHDTHTHRLSVQHCGRPGDRQHSGVLLQPNIICVSRTIPRFKYNFWYIWLHFLSSMIKLKKKIKKIEFINYYLAPLFTSLNRSNSRCSCGHWYFSADEKGGQGLSKLVRTVSLILFTIISQAWSDQVLRICCRKF